jgi:hypothetical protein
MQSKIRIKKRALRKLEHRVFTEYLSSQQKQGVMTTYQVWKIEGRQEGEAKKARLSILRGK